MLAWALVVGPAVAAAGCATTPGAGGPPVTRLITMFEVSPWLNLDRHRDPRPEGIAFVLYLWSDKLGRGVHRDGTLHVEIYKRHTVGGEAVRELVDTFTYPLSQVHRSAKPNSEFGDFYYVTLSWLPYDLSGKAIDIEVRYQDPNGRVVRESPVQKLVPANAFR
ncbi:MAG: hypothetical protein C4547_10140 [Phycisphaerales bacterium]|nr:MAG: hypothetical protein C4547_10140 [Phycisphaerales bacterium]